MALKTARRAVRAALVRTNLLAEAQAARRTMYTSRRRLRTLVKGDEIVCPRFGGLPRVSAIVPNYNHADFLAARLDSIVGQTVPIHEIIVLDDASTDDSIDVIERYRAAHPRLVRVIVNETNSGSVFTQWRRGIEAASGEVIWLCESDDFAEPDFLEHLVPEFADRGVMVAFGRIQFADRDGARVAGLDEYRERARRRFWRRPRRAPAKWWFTGPFAVFNVIPNVGGCLFRRHELPADVWQRAAQFRVLGDWYLYLKLARGGKIAFHPKAVVYFRQHGRNTSVEIQSRDEYYIEHLDIGRELRREWPVPDEQVFALYSQLSEQFVHHRPHDAGRLHELFSVDQILAQGEHRPHVMIAILGFRVGGGEIFPIHLANALVQAGHKVSVLALDETVIEPEMVAMLDPGIAVYWASEVRADGSTTFVDRVGVDVIHSHNIGTEGLFFLNHGDPLADISYLVTLHGSYEVSGLPDYEMAKIVDKVDVWVSTADRNLEVLDHFGPAEAPRLRMPNAVGPRPQSLQAKVTRRDLGIADSAVVFTLVSRPLPDKGWAETIAAFDRVRASTDRPLHLVLVGDEYEKSKLEVAWGSDPDISFLGYRSDIEDLLDLTDCCVLPTRFAGESQPLILIQAMQAGVAMVSTRVGSIPEMVGAPHDAGLLIDASPDNHRFVDDLTSAMSDALDDRVRAGLATNAATRAHDYSIDALAEAYSKLYRAAIDGRVREYALATGALVASRSGSA